MGRSTAIVGRIAATGCLLAGLAFFFGCTEVSEEDAALWVEIDQARKEGKELYEAAVELQARNRESERAIRNVERERDRETRIQTESVGLRPFRARFLVSASVGGKPRLAASKQCVTICLMRIGVTGASGFIGRALVARAVEVGHEVVAFSRSSNTAIDGVSEVRDFSEPAKATVEGLDAVVHLAGEPIVGLWTKSKRQRILSSRVEGTEGLVRAIGNCSEAERPGVLVSASGSGYYGDRGDEVLTEDDDPGLGFLASVCCEWEAAARGVEKHGVRCVMARTGMVLGADGGAAPLLKRVFQFCLGGRLGSGEQWVSWADIEDIVRMYLVACETDAVHGAVNFATPHPVTNAEFTRVIADQVHRPAIVPAPAALLKLTLQGMSEMLLNSQRLDPEVLRFSEFEWSVPSLELAIRRAFE